MERDGRGGRAKPQKMKEGHFLYRNRLKCGLSFPSPPPPSILLFRFSRSFGHFRCRPLSSSFPVHIFPPFRHFVLGGNVHQIVEEKVKKGKWDGKQPKWMEQSD